MILLFWHNIYEVLVVLKIVYMKKITAMLIGAVLLSAFTITAAMAQPPHARVYHKYYHSQRANVYLPPVPHFHRTNYGNWPPVFNVSFNTPRMVVYHEPPDPWYGKPFPVVRHKWYRTPGNRKDHWYY